MRPDVIISNATIIDGTGAPPRLGSVTIEGDRIVATDVSEDPSSTRDSSLSVIDAGGSVLAPGFVDVHTHDDMAVIAAPDHGCKTRQGVTSVVVGNCGISAAPASDHTKGLTVFDRIADYLDAVEAAQPAVNVASLVGHGAIRAAVMGLRNQAEATDAELSDMLDILATAFDDGAIGFSSGLAYEPGRYSPTSELHAFGAVAAQHGAIYTTHMRDEADRLIESVDESIAVAEANQIPLQISHLKASGQAQAGLAEGALRRIDEARERGVDVMADQYPYTRGSTLLEQIVNDGALDGSSAFGRVSTDKILVASAPRNPDWEGKTVDSIARDAGVEPRQMADRIVEAEGRACLVVIDMMLESDVRTIMAHDAVMVGTDGVPVGGKPHPRLGHTYPRILGRYVREHAVLSLSDAIRRMTSLPAERFGFVDRGVIAPGAFADLVLFDPDTILDTGTYTDPNVAPVGIRAVWVNGEQVVDGQSTTGARPGTVVRKTR